ncbi:MAG: hypothetical protein AB7R87_16590 [Parvibaculaceae bacterium]
MSAAPVLVTGFEAYGGRGSNPAYDVMRALDGRNVEGKAVVGRSLPVSFEGIRRNLALLLEENRPAAVFCLGLWPGEAMLRLERIGANVADFEIPDNDGRLVSDAMVSPDGKAAHHATLPLRAIETGLLEEGIPARISSTAGTFLCNACLFSLLDCLERTKRSIPAGFIHVPYVPEQVAAIVRDTKEAARLELHQRADIASMEFSRILRGVEIAIATTIRSLR